MKKELKTLLKEYFETIERRKKHLQELDRDCKEVAMDELHTTINKKIHAWLIDHLKRKMFRWDDLRLLDRSVLIINKYGFINRRRFKHRYFHQINFISIEKDNLSFFGAYIPNGFCEVIKKIDKILEQIGEITWTYNYEKQYPNLNEFFSEWNGLQEDKITNIQIDDWKGFTIRGEFRIANYPKCLINDEIYKGYIELLERKQYDLRKKMNRQKKLIAEIYDILDNRFEKEMVLASLTKDG